jgi:hypothetical protein
MVPREKKRVNEWFEKHGRPPNTQEFLYKLLRPELVKSNKVFFYIDTVLISFKEPLNSDAVSNFIGASYKERNAAKAAVTAATTRMITEILSNFAQEMMQNIAPSDLSDKSCVLRII